MQEVKDLFVDTSGWACYLNDKEQYHSDATAIVQSVLKKRKRLVTTSYVIGELVALLSSRYPLPRSQVVALINQIKRDSRIEVVYIDRILDDEAWTLLEGRLDKEWSLVDASSFIVMKHLSISQALTTDHHFTQAGFEQLPKRTQRRR